MEFRPKAEQLKAWDATPSKTDIRRYGLMEAIRLAKVDEEFGVPLDHDAPLTTRVMVRVPCDDGSTELVPVLGSGIRDAVDNAIVAYGDATLAFPIDPDDFFSDEYLNNTR